MRARGEEKDVQIQEGRKTKERQATKKKKNQQQHRLYVVIRPKFQGTLFSFLTDLQTAVFSSQTPNIFMQFAP